MFSVEAETEAACNKKALKIAEIGWNFWSLKYLIFAINAVNVSQAIYWQFLMYEYWWQTWWNEQFLDRKVNWARILQRITPQRHVKFSQVTATNTKIFCIQPTHE